MPSLLVTAEDDKLMQSCSIASHGCVGVDLCAPDTLDSMQGTCIFVVVQNKLSIVNNL